MTYYRSEFPAASVLPKMHILEMHVEPWLRKWKVGLGIMGEQGAESIHAAINTITPAYVNIHDKVQRLKCVIDEHHRQVCPVLQECVPTGTKRGPYKKKRKL